MIEVGARARKVAIGLIAKSILVWKSDGFCGFLVGVVFVIARRRVEYQLLVDFALLSGK